MMTSFLTTIRLRVNTHLPRKEAKKCLYKQQNKGDFMLFLCFNDILSAS